MDLIESIPNVSEGRRTDVLDRLADEVASAGPDVVLLDRTADWSHHRAVFTIAGTSDGVARAIMRLAAEAVARIDLRRHAGVHPRVGAVDVVPFVALGHTPAPRAITLARAVAEQLARELQLPTFLYEAAARQPDRQRLELVRRGGFEQLAARMASAGGQPDFGPPVPHPTAGATIVGARGPLVAWNLNLATDEVAVAREIARLIRASNGGLPHVKAMGVPLVTRGLVQVSMNLTDYRTTSMSRVFAAVDAAARARGTSIEESEIIGLVPRDALDEVAGQVPWLGECHGHQVLEDRLAAHVAGGVRLKPDTTPRQRRSRLQRRAPLRAAARPGRTMAWKQARVVAAERAVGALGGLGGLASLPRREGAMPKARILR